MERVIIGGGQREYWIDVCKGMGIILVLLAHAIKKECILWIAINQFHMPLFFVISGYLYTGRDKIFTFVYKKLKGLYIPYLISSLIMYAIFVRIGQEPFSVTELVKILIMYRTGPLLGALWFLRVLFWASIIYDCFNRIISKKALFFLSIILLTIGVHISLPLRLSNILVAIGFMAIGNRAKEHKWNVNEWLFIPCFAIVWIASLYTRVSVSTNTYTIPILFIVIALIGTVGTVSLCKLIMKTKEIEKLFSWLGKNTLGIVIWQFVAFKIVTVIQISFLKLEWSRIVDFPVIYDYATIEWVLLNVIIGSLCSIGIYRIQDNLTGIVLRPIDIRVKNYLNRYDLPYSN